MSNSADSPQAGSGSLETGPIPAPGRGFPPVRVLTVGVFALAGLLFFTSFNTARGTNIRTDSSLLKLSDLIQERSHKNARLDETNAALRGDIEGLAKRTGGGTGKAEQARLAALEQNAGTQKLTGKAVTVTLNDAPPDATAKLPGYPEPQPDYLVIHQQDLQAVVNALWLGGAQGIKVMDQRLISTSAVRCVGNTLILQGRVYSPPYKITAIGDPDKLQKALAASPAIQNYMVYVNVYGLGWKVTEDGTVTLPGYTGAVDLHYAKPVE
ncbi:DUF881 domain-containing protein [Streptomyces nodosus]|uniref:DUF881 domain-containing protein n=1 Tax=Streptomyces nodosus TaxID=40318 RepID=A0A5P2W352_9ACTN|nr:DUF881 domain-containing protein [Streptomyces nodosus]MBB4792778.1 uncharacterized protein YlxW (UPF0749 family) [Streptomyces nodosus]QEV40108.1 DUF881 domain-containing protein [Streptomyces nodosus]